MADRLRTPLCDMLGIEHPIILAGMGGTYGGDRMPTHPRLAAAVTNAGGLGMMGCGNRKLEDIEWCIREVRRLTSGPFGIDLLLPASVAEMEVETKAQMRERVEHDYPEHVAFVKELVRRFNLPEVEMEDNEPPMTPAQIRKQFEVVLDNRVPVFVAGLGEPSWVVPLGRPQGMKIGGMAGAVRHALRQKAAGADFVGAQGTEAGGHTGNIANFPLIPQIVDAIAPIPVMAAGAISTGRQVAAALVLGAQAVWVGTAFLVAEESDILDAHKEQILRGQSEDFTLSKVSSGKQARFYKNPAKDIDWAQSGLATLPMPLQGILMEPFVKAAQKAGRWDLSTIPSGQGGGIVKERRPARDILLDMVREAEETIERLQASVR